MYAWYELLGLGMLVGTLCFLVFRGLDLLLEAWLDRRLDRELKQMNRPPALPRRIPGKSLEHLDVDTDDCS